MNVYNTFEYDGIVRIDFRNVPEVNDALLTGKFQAADLAIRAFVRKYKEEEQLRTLVPLLAVMTFEPPPLVRPDGTRLCDRCYEPLPAFAHGRRKRHTACQ